MTIWMLSTDTIPDRRYEVLGLLIEQEMLGLNVARDLTAMIKDFFGGRVRSYDRPLRDGMTRCFARLEERVKEAGGHGLIGVRIAITPVPFKRMTMLQVCAYGTAFRLLDEPPAA